MHNMLPVGVSLGALPWHISLSHSDAATRVTTGYVTGLHLAISVPLLGCTAVADGTGADTHTGLLAASYSDNTHVLSAMSTGNGVRGYDVDHCDGLIKDGDAVVLSANYAVRPCQRISHS